LRWRFDTDLFASRGNSAVGFSDVQTLVAPEAAEGQGRSVTIVRGIHESEFAAR